jgi:hypothetical protein
MRAGKGQKSVPARPPAPYHHPVRKSGIHANGARKGTGSALCYAGSLGEQGRAGRPNAGAGATAGVPDLGAQGAARSGARRVRAVKLSVPLSPGDHGHRQEPSPASQIR